MVMFTACPTVQVLSVTQIRLASNHNVSDKIIDGILSLCISITYLYFVPAVFSGPGGFVL